VALDGVGQSTLFIRASSLEPARESLRAILYIKVDVDPQRAGSST
jgi:hypothetical protein